MQQMFAKRHAMAMVHHDPVQREVNDSMPADGSDHIDSDHNDSDHDEPVDVHNRTRHVEDSEVDDQPFGNEETPFITSSEQDDFYAERLR